MFDLWTRKNPVSTSDFVDVSGMKQHEFPTALEELWSNLSQKFNEKSLHYAHAALLGFDYFSTSRLREMCIQLNVVKCAEMASVQVLNKDPCLLAGYDVIILNLDAFDDIMQAVEILRRFRIRLPEVTVILISNAVRGDDLGCERAPICDATLRAPVTILRLQEAFKVSISRPHC